MGKVTQRTMTAAEAEKIVKKARSIGMIYPNEFQGIKAHTGEEVETPLHKLGEKVLGFYDRGFSGNHMSNCVSNAVEKFKEAATPAQAPSPGTPKAHPAYRLDPDPETGKMGHVGPKKKTCPRCHGSRNEAGRATMCYECAGTGTVDA